MERFVGILLNKDGDPVTGVTVQINLAGTGTPASIFSDNGGTTKTNPFTNDANGVFWFYADSTLTYDAVPSGTDPETGLPFVFDLAVYRDLPRSWDPGDGVQVKNPTAFIRLIGIENSGKDIRLRQYQGILYLERNDGTEASPTWVTVFSQTLSSLNIIPLGTLDCETSSTGRLVVPADPTTSPITASDPAGSMAVHGAEFKFVDAVTPTRNVWRGTGDDIAAATGAVIGSVWVEGDNFFYVDTNGRKRRLQTQDIAAITGRRGSVWVDSGVSPNRLDWNSETDRRKRWHADVAHSDAAHSDSHSNTHSNSHSNSHSNTGSTKSHANSHSNSHSNTHSDTHSNVAHSDVAFSDVPVTP